MLGPPGRGREASLAAGSGQERAERGGGEAGRTRLGRACSFVRRVSLIPNAVRWHCEVIP